MNAAGTGTIANLAGITFTDGASADSAIDNVISGNTLSGISMINYYTSSGSSNNLVQGNLIGTDPTGMIALGNSGPGVVIYATSSGNTIGGTTAAARNIISANASAGVSITGTGASGNIIIGNYIGTNSAGTAALGNSGDGVILSGGTTGNTVGGAVAGSGNVISGNSGAGVDIVGSSSNLVAMNWIGTTAAGTAELGNTGDGVLVSQSAANTIGGTSVGAGNLTSANTNGVEINDSSSTLIEGNLIGLDQTGTLAFGNTGAGVLVDAGSSGTTIGGAVGGRNEISGNAEGVMITGAATTGTLIAGNLIGTDVEGTVAVGNKGAGIEIAGGTGTTIGGTTSVARNVISGNKGDGVDVDSGVTSTLVQGNYIGIDQSATIALGNTGDGVSIAVAPGTTIGGTTQGSGNVISGNLGAGLTIEGGASPAALVLGNRIGTDYRATTAVPNGTFGVLLNGASDVTIGGTASGSRNIIAGNLDAGIGLYGGTTGTVIQGNWIGTDDTGSNPLGNATGVQIDGGSSSNTIGGTAAGAGNTIAFSTGIGVDVDATAGTGNAIRLNSIFSSTGVGISLGGGGVILNTPGGPHTGPNDLQNYPVITQVTSAGGTTTVTGTFNSTPSTTFALDFYTLSSVNASGYGEGRYVLGSGSVSTDSSGNASFSFAFNTPASGTQFVTATATDPGGNTSEFSQEFGIDHAPTARMSFSTLTVNEGVPVSFDGAASTSPDGDLLTYTWNFDDGATATGPAPSHTYTSAGTDTVTLTVNDGFGGISTAQATVTVVDVPPAFTPDSYTAPLTYTAPVPGSGFGASVAFDYGDVAIGAPFDNSPSVKDTGQVYLYDATPEVDAATTTYAYGQLIHVFADPNPEHGDEFGASLAVIGNDLVVGAPGSSLSGPGDGVAYVFDANVESTTFGDLLATLTIPDAASQSQAHFGASVGATDSNILVGAPGASSGKGGVYEFDGDTTDPSFGSLVLPISNPDKQAGSQFGAAVAALGDNIIVGAPYDSTGGAQTGTVYEFDGTTGAGAGAHHQPGRFQRLRLGRRVCRIEHPDRVAVR